MFSSKLINLTIHSLSSNCKDISNENESLDSVNLKSNVSCRFVSVY